MLQYVLQNKAFRKRMRSGGCFNRIKQKIKKL